ncbi:selenocysteine lyase/cysteine desulfurase [Novosphingobium chloroacetimidivorans]|uniref:Selenocysteine lyase/cysteine desulfurase n=1 Tax=Novosphingobium chloroacetimidivorans TaxID=1428314 RepID=A0A7W7KDP0_9SPHN|nr:aminotransferase class V-fold PLP-dependent enzyme [Novosphingobium chloroacetimidivorans]MBB4860935.1 selenocysteine lyase/cysteine desulfurase [Novosphingobium chloroacetimidivorans]
MSFDRRRVLIGAGALPLAAGLASALPAAARGKTDPAFWRGVAEQYDAPRDVIQLENGNWGMMARPVAAEYATQVSRVNRDTSYYARRGMGADLVAARNALAGALGVPAEQIAMTRNATEALQALILGYNRLKAGDSVLYADLDYDSMQACMESLRAHRGVNVRRIALPYPATRVSLVDAYRAAFDADPRIRLVLLTHLSHRTGLVVPVREIVRLARERGIDAIVDAAHSWYQLDFALPDLDCDFVAINGHKWLGAPLGVAAMYIRETVLDRIDKHPANDADAANNTQARVHTGTVDFAAQLTVPAALAFQEGIGRTRRAERLRSLRNRWVRQVRGVDGIEVLTPDDPELHGGITSFRLRGITDVAGNMAIARTLLEQHGIFTVHRDGVAGGACVRVSPALFNTETQMDALASALRLMASGHG